MKNPTSIQDAIQKITEDWKSDKETVNAINKMTEDDFAATCQSIYLSGGVGMHIRNTFGLWQKTGPIATEFKDAYGITHPDSMSDYLIRQAYKNLKNIKE